MNITEPITNQIPVFSLPITEFLELLWTYNSSRNNYMDNAATVSRSLGDRILQVIPNDLYCHVSINEDRPLVALVYSLSDWKVAYARELEKIASREKAEAYNEWKRETCVKLFNAVKRSELLGEILGDDDERIREYAESILRGGKVTAAKNLGVDITWTWTKKGEV